MKLSTLGRMKLSIWFCLSTMQALYMPIAQEPVLFIYNRCSRNWRCKATQSNTLRGATGTTQLAALTLGSLRLA